MRYLIIGGGIAGVSAAKAIREHDADGTIIVYTSEFHPLGLYARHHIARRLADGPYDYDDLLMETPEALAEQDIRFEYHDIEKIFPERGEILKAHNVRRIYERLLIATGATPLLLDVPGIRYIGVHQLRNPDDMLLIQGWLPELKEHGAVIIGGGVLGLDMARSLVAQHVPVTLIVREAHVGVPLLDEAGGRVVERRLAADGVRVLLNQQVSAYMSQDERLLDAVRLDDGTEIPTRMALNAIGVTPRTDLAEDTSLAVHHESGALIINEHMQTNIPNIYAAGNCAQVNGIVARNWTASAAQGRIAGLNMVGKTAMWQPSMAADLHSHLYDLPLACFGHFPADAQQIVWSDDGDERAARFALRDSVLVGGTFLGDFGTLPENLFAQYQAGEQVDVAELRQLA